MGTGRPAGKQAARPGPGERHNPGPPTTPRQAAAVVLLRACADGRAGVELLLVKRTPAARFMGGVWVFPGGALTEPQAPTAEARAGPSGVGDSRGREHAAAGGEQAAAERTRDAHMDAAARELQEEAGIELSADQELVELARWITPAQVHTRFDTRFFLARLPAGQHARVDGEECVEHRWLTPRAALDAHAAGLLDLVFPTIKQLEELDELSRAHRDVDALMAALKGRSVEPIEPRVVTVEGQPRIALPGEPGYDAA